MQNHQIVKWVQEMENLSYEQLTSVIDFLVSVRERKIPMTVVSNPMLESDYVENNKFASVKKYRERVGCSLRVAMSAYDLFLKDRNKC